MSDPEPTPEPEPDPDPEPQADTPSLLVTTTRTKDYLARALTNTVPGTSNATDHLGRNVGAGNTDFLGRALVP